MTTADEWQGPVGQNWARSYELTDRAFRGVTGHLLAAIADLPGADIVDIGCGAGELALALAAARPQARVTGVDISAELVAAASQRSADTARCSFTVGDAATWQPERAPDLLVSRHGVMFFDDPVAAFTHLRAVAAPGAALAFSCFRSATKPLPVRSSSGRAGPLSPCAAPTPGSSPARATMRSTRR